MLPFGPQSLKLLIQQDCFLLLLQNGDASGDLLELTLDCFPSILYDTNFWVWKVQLTLAEEDDEKAVTDITDLKQDVTPPQIGGLHRVDDFVEVAIGHLNILKAFQASEEGADCLVLLTGPIHGIFVQTLDQLPLLGAQISQSLLEISLLDFIDVLELSQFDAISQGRSS